MIRINLLPVRAAKKKETALQQIFISGFSFILVLVIVLSLWGWKIAKISTVKNDITAADAKNKELLIKIGKLKDTEKLKAEVTKKLDVLNQLRKNKTGPATRLATLSDVTPDQLWLEKYKENGRDISISGFSTNEELIAQFIRAIEASPEYEKVELLVSEQRDVSGNKLKHFDLTFKIETPGQPQK